MRGILFVGQFGYFESVDADGAGLVASELLDELRIVGSADGSCYFCVGVII